MVSDCRVRRNPRTSLGGSQDTGFDCSYVSVTLVWVPHRTCDHRSLLSRTGDQTPHSCKILKGLRLNGKFMHHRHTTYMLCILSHATLRSQVGYLCSWHWRKHSKKCINMQISNSPSKTKTEAKRNKCYYKKKHILFLNYFLFKITMFKCSHYELTKLFMVGFQAHFPHSHYQCPLPTTMTPLCLVPPPQICFYKMLLLLLVFKFCSVVYYPAKDTFHLGDCRKAGSKG